MRDSCTSPAGTLEPGRFGRAPGLALAVALALLLAACSGTADDSGSDGSTSEPLPTYEIESGGYDLGDSTIAQASFAADSRFRNMPVRLNGYAAAPAEGGPFPLVVILHGAHPGCPAAGELDPWPCDPAVEQANYSGMSWLADAIAVHGYVAVAPNINAEYTFGFGEAPPNERLPQIIDQHLAAIDEISSVPVDSDRFALVGHSRGGGSAVELTREKGLAFDADALVLLAAAPVAVDPEGGLPVPTGMLLPACDADVVDQEGQAFYEASRLSQQAWATSLWLPGGNHNNNNTILSPDQFELDRRPDCDQQLSGERQRDVTGEFTVDVLTTVFGTQEQAAGAMQRLGIDVAQPAASSLYGVPAQSSYLPPVADRTLLMLPTGADQLTGEGVTTTYCPDGYYVPLQDPIAVPCRRAVLVVPGQPAHGIVTWQERGATLSLPVTQSDLGDYRAFSIRVVIDPLSDSNPVGKPQSFSVRITDADGKSATVDVGTDQPALQYPAGEATESEFFDGDTFTGRAPLEPVRVQLQDFAGVDLSRVSDIDMVFDRTDSGSLFVADAEVVKSAVP